MLLLKPILRCMAIWLCCFGIHAESSITDQEDQSDNRNLQQAAYRLFVVNTNTNAQVQELDITNNDVINLSQTGTAISLVVEPTSGSNINKVLFLLNDNSGTNDGGADFAKTPVSSPDPFALVGSNGNNVLPASQLTRIGNHELLLRTFNNNDLRLGADTINFVVRNFGLSPTQPAPVTPAPVASPVAAPVAAPVAPTPAGTGTIVINEILASNTNTIADRDGEFEDYLELRNTGNGPVSLAGYTLTDDVEDPKQWTFPAGLPALPANGYLLVFCSGKDYEYNAAAGETELHTNFKLGADGEYLGLYRPGGAVEDEFAPNFPVQSEDVAFGIVNNDSGLIRYFNNPTPGTVNRGGGNLAPVANIEVSVDRGFYTAAFSLTLSTSTPNAEIRYTTNGREPTSSFGTIYSGSIRIQTTTQIRAVAYVQNFVNSKVETVSYIFLQDVIQQPRNVAGFPNGEQRNTAGGSPVSLDMEMDPAIVSEYSSEIIQAMESIPTMSITASVSDLFGSNGLYIGTADNEHKVSMEMLYADDPEKNEQIDCGLQSHSHDRLKRSLRIDFRDRYGASKWKTDLFRDTPFNAKADGVVKTSNEFDTLILRGGNNRSWARRWNPDATSYTIDQFYRSSQIAMSEIGSHGTFVHLYLNGVYWGLYNPVERPDEFLGEEYIGGDKDFWFYTNHGGAGSGDRSRWNYIKGGLSNKNMAIAANYDEFKEHVDVESFCDYLLLAFYMGITDWPQNNWYVIHRQPDHPDGPTPAKFIAWDGEWSFDRRSGANEGGGATVYPEFSNFRSSNSDIVTIWNAAFESADFRATFAQRANQHTRFGGALSDAVALARWDDINNHIESAVIGESARWGDSLKELGGRFDVTRTRDEDWRDQVQNIRSIINGNAGGLRDVLEDSGLI